MGTDLFASISFSPFEIYREEDMIQMHGRFVMRSPYFLLLLAAILANCPICLGGEDQEGRTSAFLLRYASNGQDYLPNDARADALEQLRANIDAGRVGTESQRSDGATWVQLGPGWLADKFDQRFTGRITAIAVHPDHDDVVFLGTANGGVWKTVNNGATWTSETDFMDSLAIRSLAITTGVEDGEPVTAVYAGTGEGKLPCDAYYGLGLLRGIYTTISDDGDWELRGSDEEHLQHRSITSVVVHPEDHDWILVGTGLGASGWTGTTDGDCTLGWDISEKYGVWGSSNGGETWTEQPLFDARPPDYQSTTVGSDFVTDLEIQSVTSDSMKVLIGVADTYGLGPWVGGVYRASVEWTTGAPPTLFENNETLKDFPGDYVYRVELDVSPLSRIYAAFAGDMRGYPAGANNWGGLFVSSDLGGEWGELTKLNTSGDNDPKGTNKCMSEFDADHALYCDEFGLHDDDGVEYCCTGPNTPGCTVYEVCSGPARPPQCGYDLALEVDLSDGGDEQVWLGGIGIWRGEVTGTTGSLSISWDDMCTPAVHVDQHAIAITNGTRRVWLANDGGIVSANSSHGPSWDSMNNDELNLVQFYPGASLHSTASQLFSLAGTQDNGVLRYDADDPFDPGWHQKIGHSDGASTALTPDGYEETHLFAGLTKNFLFGSADGGSVWKNTSDHSSHSWIPPVNVCRDLGSSGLYAMFSSRTIIHSIEYSSWPPDLTQTQSDISIDPFAAIIPFSSRPYVTAIEYIDKENDCGSFWVGGDSGSLVRVSGHGSTVSPVYTPLGTEDKRAVTSIAVHPSNPEIVFASFGGFGGPHIMYSENAMTGDPVAWQAADGSDYSDSQKGATDFDYLPDVPVLKVLIDSANEALFAGTDLGVFVSLDWGETWDWSDNEHPNSPVYDLVESNGTLVSFTHGRGAWELTGFSGLVFTVDTSSDDPDSDGLNGNCQTAAGECSLRAALQESNYSPERNTIRFSIDHVEVVGDIGLPPISNPVTIDGAAGNLPGSVRIHKGPGSNYGGNGLRITAGDSVLKGLVVNGFGKSGVQLLNGGGNTVTNCTLGSVDSDHTDNQWNGLLIDNSSGNSIGLEDAGNVIAGNGTNGVRIRNSNGTTLTGNEIGRTGFGNGQQGIRLEDSSNTKVVANTIAYNSGDGVSVVENPGYVSIDNSFLGNAIFENGQLGIDLGNDGATANDYPDDDQGPNEFLNYPVISSASVNWGNGGFYIHGSYNNGGSPPQPPSPSFLLQFFADKPYLGGDNQFFLAETVVTQDANGDVGFHVQGTSFPIAQYPYLITATATRLSPSMERLSTSEFSLGYMIPVPR